MACSRPSLCHAVAIDYVDIDDDQSGGAVTYYIWDGEWNSEVDARLAVDSGSIVQSDLYVDAYIIFLYKLWLDDQSDKLFDYFIIEEN